jgi:hypothetical protein
MPTEESILAGATVVLALSGVGGLIWQSLQRRKAQGDDFLWRLVQRWESDEMRARRIQVASDFLHHGKDTRNTVDILNFLELLGYFVRSGTIPESGAWLYFVDVVFGYRLAANGLIVRQRLGPQGDPTVFQDLLGLVDTLLKIEAKKRKIRGNGPKVTLQDAGWDPEEVRGFLRYETELAYLPEPSRWKLFIKRAAPGALDSLSDAIRTRRR